MQTNTVNSFVSKIHEAASQLGPSSFQDPSQQSSFSTMFAQALSQVNELQNQASRLTEAYELGDKSITLPEVMVALQEASVSFQAVTQVRNHVVQAYKDVMNMPI